MRITKEIVEFIDNSIRDNCKNKKAKGRKPEKEKKKA